MSPLPQTSSDRARRVELWSDLEAAGGSPLSVVPEGVFWDGRLDERLEEAARLRLSVSREHDSWADVDETHVIRLDYSDSKALEFRIAEIEERIGDDGARTAQLTALSPLDDLEVRDGLLRRVEANGRLRYQFTVLGIPPADHLDLILGGPTAYASGAPSHFSAGTVEPTAPIDVVYDSDTPLSALRQVVSNVEGGAELQLRRDGASGYLIDILNEVGSDASQPYVNLGRNLDAFDRRRSTDEQGTRVVPFGSGGGEDRRATMARAAWTVASVSGSDVTFEDDILNEDGQLVGRYVEKENGTLTEVTASTSPDTVTVADATNISAGDLLRFRENSAGDQLAWLESPSAVTRYGVIQRQIDRGDVPPVDNVVPNAFLSAWTSGSPDSWSVIGSPPVAENNNEEFTRKGGASARVGDGGTKAAEGEGLQTVAIDVAPTAEEPYFTGQISLWVVSGSVEILLVDESNGVTFPPSGSEQRAVTDETGVWVENLAVAGYEAPGTSSMRLQVVAAEDGTEFYLDAGQLTNTASGRSTFYDGRASNRLWQAALDELATNAEPQVSYGLTVSDLTALDDATWPGEELYLGQTVRLRAEDIGVDVQRRIQRISRDPFQPTEVETLEVESRRAALSRRLAGRERRRRPGEGERPTDLSRPEDVTGFDGFFADRAVLTWDQSRGAARYEIRQQGSGADAQARWDNGTVYARPAGTDFTDTDPPAGTLDLTIKAVGPQGRYSSNAAELTVSRTGELIEEETEETEDTGTVRVTPIWGDSSRTFQIEWWWREANNTFSASADQTDTGVAHGGTRSFTNPLPEEHGGAAKYRVTDEATGIAIVENTVKFDQNKVPNHQGHTLVRIGGDVYLLHQGDADWASLKYDKSVGDSPAEPTRSDVQNGVTVGGRTGRTKIEDSLAKGQEIEVGVLGYSQSSAGGLESAEVWRDSVSRPGAEDVLQVAPTPAALPVGISATGMDYDLDALPKAETVGPVEVAYKVDTPAGQGSYSAWQDVSGATTYAITVTRQAEKAGDEQNLLYVKARDAGASGQPESDPIQVPVPPVDRRGLDPDGRVDPGSDPGGSYSPPGGAQVPVLRSIFDQSFQEAQNLLGPDAGPEGSQDAGAIGGLAYTYLNGVPIADLGLEVGDTISAAVQARNDGGDQQGRIWVEFLDSGGNRVDRFSGNWASSSSYTRSTLEDLTIPANTVDIKVAVDDDNSATTGQLFWRRAILVKGPTVRTFGEPPIRTQRETAADIYRTTSRAAHVQQIVQRLQDSGDLDRDIQHGSGFRVSRHHEEDAEHDGQTGISFSNQYDAVPHSVVTPADGARIYATSQSGSDQRHRLKTQGLDKQGFDELVGEILISTTTTHITDGFGEDRGDGTAPSQTLNSDGDVTYSNLEDADIGAAATFVVAFDWDATDLEVGDSATLHIEVNDGANSFSSWTEVATYALTPGNSATDQTVSFTKDLGANYDIRARLTVSASPQSEQDLSDAVSVTMHLEGDNPAGVEWDRDDGSVTESMSPNGAGAGENVLWQAEDTN